MKHPAASPADAPLKWCAVLESEYEALYGAKPAGLPSDDLERLKALHLLIHQRRPTALCLSGGGIRSATFGLGVLQALARIGVLGKLDYLSTVSGGGYVGGWLTSWLHRDGRDEVMRGLDPAQVGAMRGEEARCSPVNRLRATCRYLAPKGGLVSADLWTLFATMGRNLLLNWLVLLPLIAAVLLAPRIYLAMVSIIDQNVMAPPGTAMPAGGRRALLARTALPDDVPGRDRLRRHELRGSRRQLVAAAVSVVRGWANDCRHGRTHAVLVGVPLRT